MSVVVQSMLAPDLSFVLHTAHPISRDPATLAAELAPGLGETLAAGEHPVLLLPGAWLGQWGWLGQ